METVNASIPLSAGNIRGGPNPQQTMSLMEFSQQMQQRRQQQAAQNALRTIFADPNSMGPDGQLRPESIQRVMAIDPNTGMQLRQSMLMNQVHQSTISKNQMQQQGAVLEQNLKKDDYLQRTVREPALIAYEDAKKKGYTDQQANEVSQTEYSKGIQAAKGSGLFHEDEADKFPPAFDYQRVQSRSQSLKDYRANEEKKAADLRAENLQTERYRHNLSTEDAASRRETNAEVRMNRVLAARAAFPNAAFDDATKTFMAQQYLSGDKSVMQNLGRGVQGSKNIIDLRKEIVSQAKLKGADASEVSAALAEFEGLKAGERTVGMRTANVELAVSEASKFAELALDASKNSSRTGFLPTNKALQMWQKGTGDTKISTFVAANTSFINAYARAVSPSGTSRVSDKEHAREMLDTAQTPQQYEAVIGQLQKEMKAARQAPGEVKSAMRDLHTGKTSGDHAAPARVASDADFAALPSGALFIGPDGKTRRKP